MQGKFLSITAKCQLSLDPTGQASPKGQLQGTCQTSFCISTRGQSMPGVANLWHTAASCLCYWKFYLVHTTGLCSGYPTDVPSRAQSQLPYFLPQAFRPHQHTQAGNGINNGVVIHFLWLFRLSQNYVQFPLTLQVLRTVFNKSFAKQDGSECTKSKSKIKTTSKSGTHLQIHTR